ncbi:MAG: peptidoglycan-binding protein LysM [Candidatus Krumholzibacteria bacterium]|nr:peptidoglycan-binding protein LysM [Candidatus Krumholzibacteria bacterium]
MGFFDFVKDAGDKVMNRDEDKAAELNQAKADSLTGHVMSLGLNLENLAVTFDDGLAVVSGVADSQADKEKVLLKIGNTYGVARIDDRLKVEVPEPEALFYTVKSGDTLGGIAKSQYGNAGKYPVIFEANKPMLTDPNKIYPGQVLRIPALD